MAGKCRLWCSLISSSIGVLLGLSACIVFSVFYKNVQAGMWALASAMFAAITLHLHILQYREQLESWHSRETLKDIKFLGLAVMLIGLGGLGWYIFITVYEHIPVLPVSESTIITSVWAFMTAKWGFLLLFSAWHYVQYVNHESDPLLRT